MPTCHHFHKLIPALLLFAAVPSADAYPQKSTAAYTVTDLGGLPGLSFEESDALAINDYGEIAGSSYTAGPDGSVEHAVVWARDASGKYAITDLGIIGEATSINNAGEVAAGGFLIRPVTVNGNLVWYQDVNGDGVNDLAIPADPGADAINNSMQYVGGSDYVQFDDAGNEMVTTLSDNGTGYAINDSGLVAGESGVTRQATIWDIDGTGKIVSEETLSPLPGNTFSSALCIDAFGRVAGYSGHLVSPIAYQPRATLWQNGATPTDLGAPANSGSFARGVSTVNGVLQVVGFYNHNGESAFLWKNGAMKDLNTLVSASGVALSEAKAINSRGQIVGSARFTVGKNPVQIHGFLLTPN
jgi:probable HAF family extracellular repeat protein